tara:strand:- start:348 stop:4985 length:4638 start_codon:yes stop_codon:yes gene_type:complete
MSDPLNTQPDALGSADLGLEVEGWEEQSEFTQDQYPDQFPTETEVQTEGLDQEQTEGGQQTKPVPNYITQTEELITGERTEFEQPTLPQEVETKEEVEPKPVYRKHLNKRVIAEDGLATYESILDADNNVIADLDNGREMIDILKLRNTYNQGKEDKVIELLDDQNLENKLKAFMMIRDDPELRAIFDHNGDGEITYDDFFDTTNLNDGKGMTDEEDAIATQQWLESLQNKNVGARLGALWRDYGAGQNMALLIAKRRRGYFNPEAWGEDYLQAGSGAWFDTGADFLETVGSIGDVMQGRSWFDDSQFDDKLLQHKNTKSMEFIVNNPLVNTTRSKMIYDVSYWGTTGLLTAATGGTFAKATAATKIPKIVGLGKGVKAVTHGGWFKGTVADTVIPGHFKNFQEHGVGMMRRNGAITGVVDMMGGAGEVFSPEVANMINSPTFKKYDHVYTEGLLGAGTLWLGGGLFKHIFLKSGFVRNSFLPGVQRWGDKNIMQLVNSKKPSILRVGTKMLNQETYFDAIQQQAGDLARAGKEQLQSNLQGFRATFNQGVDSNGLLNSAYGIYKNGQRLVGQGWTKIRKGIRDVIYDVEEIANTIGLRKAHQATDALLDQVDMRKAAKAGISEIRLDQLGKELIDDVNYKAELDRINPLKDVTRSEASKTALRNTLETVLGRNAGDLEPSDFWSGDILNSPLNIGNFDKMSDINKWAVRNIEVADAVNQSLLMQLRDSAQVAGEMIGKTDVFATDGVVSRIADNLLVGLSHVKRTTHVHKLARQLVAENGGKITDDVMVEIMEASTKAGRRIHRETKEGINQMVNMLLEKGDDDLVEALLDVFKISNDIHNWKDWDAWMHQMIVGGKFNGQTKTGDLIKGLQQVMVQSILSGPKTPLRAILGTTANTYLNAVNEAFGATIRRPFTNDIASQKASIAKLKALFGQIPEAYEVFQKSWNSKFNANIADIRTRFTEGESVADELWNAKAAHVEARGTDGEKAAFYINNTTRWMTNNKLFSWVPRALAATDDTFMWLMARARSKEIAMRQVLDMAGNDHTKITPELLKQAEEIHFNHLLDSDGNINVSNDSFLKKQFEEVTLTSELKGTAAKLDDVFNSIPMIKPFYLFARTGINGLNFTYKNTPLLGALHKESIDILTHKGNDFTSLAQYGIENVNDLANARNLFAGRQAMGATVVTTMSGMYMAGQLTGNGPADRQLKQQWINAGWKPNHIYIGDVGFDYRTLEPFNVIWSAIADVGDNLELMGSEWAEKRLQAVAFVIGRGVTGKTYMSGLDQLMQIAQMKPGSFDRAAGNILNNSIPLAGMRNEFGKWINPHMKELNSDMWDGIRNRNQASELLAFEKLPIKHDILNGTPINNWNIIGRSYNAISPIHIDIRNDTPGRRLLLDSNYDMNSTTYGYAGYSFQKSAAVRSHFQNAIGSVPIRFQGKTYSNLEEALNYISTLQVVKNSMAKMQQDSGNPANWDLDPNTYPHNTIIDNLFDQARHKAWTLINSEDHPGYFAVQQVKAEKDGKDTKTRDNRNEIIELSFPRKQIETYPK